MPLIVAVLSGRGYDHSFVPKYGMRQLDLVRSLTVII